jgi:hypothetical protein
MSITIVISAVTSANFTQVRSSEHRRMPIVGCLPSFASFEV